MDEWDRSMLAVSGAEYEIQEGGGAMLRRVSPFDVVFHLALSDTLEEWDSPEDDEAFSDL